MAKVPQLRKRVSRRGHRSSSQNSMSKRTLQRAWHRRSIIKLLMKIILLMLTINNSNTKLHLLTLSKKKEVLPVVIKKKLKKFIRLNCQRNN